MNDIAEDIKYFDASSRIGRLRYLAYPIGLFLMLIPVFLVAALLFPLHLGLLGALIVIAAEIFALVMGVVFMIRRLHDIDRSGWWALIYGALLVWSFVVMFRGILNHPLEPQPLSSLIPSLLSLIYFLVLVLVPGSRGENRFGPVPPPNSGWVIAGAWAWILIILLGILAAISIPAYQDYIARSQTAEAIQLAGGAEQSIVSYHDQNKAWPTDLSSLYPKNPDGGIGRYSAGVTAVTVTDGSYGIMVAMKQTGVALPIAGKRVELWTTDGGKTWHCGPASMDPVDAKYLVASCRSTDAP
ncbi:MAG TPA: DUF805 domain-containing protein [Gammaproteobacteria bacterium]|jgi:uncharacterized membrane protein YhaH (DUF805 family)/Tfp pilus assembly major pilin PilA